ncbi:MAG: hypothetical protein ACWA5Q_11970 [bacterium]
MEKLLQDIRPGLLLVMLALLFGIGLGVGFGVNEDYFKDYIAQGIQANPEVHDAKSQSKIWRYGQRAHFHATGIAAFSIGLLLLTGATRLKSSVKKLTSILIGLGGLYPLAWFAMFVMAPSMGRGAAHDHLVTETLTYVGTGGLIAGLVILMIGLADK